jgi:hypothetical protein
MMCRWTRQERRDHVKNGTWVRPFGHNCPDGRFSKPRPDCTKREERSEVRVGGTESSTALSDCSRPPTMCCRARPFVQCPDLRPSAGGTPGPVQYGENRNTEKVLAECFHAISDVNAVPSFARLDLGSGRFARSPAPEDFRSAFLVDLDHAGKTPLRTFLDPTVEGATVFELEFGFAFLAEAEVCTEAFHWH